MNNEHIKEVFKKYLETSNTQYALLLNGAWGSGKTFFWKNALCKVATENGHKPIYITLNGVNTIEALEQRFFIACLSENNKLAKAAIDFFSFMSKKAINTNYADIAKSIENYSTYIVCFDDLERCQIPMKVVLGFINDFVEHKNLKIIIFAEGTKTQEDFKEIKEKLIGRELFFELNMKETLPLLFEKYKEKDVNFRLFLLEYEAHILQLLLEYNVNNLRTVAFYLDTLKELFPAFKDIKKEYIEEILFFSAIITIEFKLGRLQSSDANNPKGIDGINWNFIITLAQNSGRDIRKEYADEFQEKYLKNKIENYTFYASIYSYILSGHSQINELKKEIENRYLKTIPQSVKELNVLLWPDFRKLSNSDFDIIVENVLKYAKDGVYSIYQYVVIAKQYYYFVKKQLINKSISEINQILFNGIDIAKARKETNRREYENLNYSCDIDIQIIKERIDAVHQEIQQEIHSNESKRFLDCFTSDEDKILNEVFEKDTTEIFKRIDKTMLLQAIIKSHNAQNYNFNSLIRTRYKSKSISEVFSEDYDSMHLLEEGLSIFLTENLKLEPLKKNLLKELLEDLNEICAKLAPKTPTT